MHLNYEKIIMSWAAKFPTTIYKREYFIVRHSHQNHFCRKSFFIIYRN